MSVLPNKLHISLYESIISTVTREEIIEVLKSMPRKNFPRLDGFPIDGHTYSGGFQSSKHLRESLMLLLLP